MTRQERTVVPQTILGTAPFVRFGMFLARTIPRGASYALAKVVAGQMARRRTAMFRGVRANLAHVLGSQADAETLDRLARLAIEHAGHTYVDMFRTTPEDFRARSDAHGDRSRDVGASAGGHARPTRHGPGGAAHGEL